EIVFRPGGALPAETAARLVAEQRFGARTRELLGEVRAFPEQFARARAERCDPQLFHGVAPVSGETNDGLGRRLSTADWPVFYMVPRATLPAPVTSLTIRRAIVSIAVGIAALLTGIVLAAMLIRPVRTLARATGAVAAGDLSVRVHADRNDEL